MNAALITVWSDYVCPFCYLELPVLERIQRELGDSVRLEWKPFELRPEPEPTLDPDGDYLHDVWSRAVYPMAEIRGLPIKLPPVQPRSRLALQAAEFARNEGRFEAMHRALFKAFFEEGRDIGDVEAILPVARSVGLNPEALRFSLDLGEFSRKVDEDRALAIAAGIDSVPAFVVSAPASAPGKGFRIDGAVDYKTLRRAVDRALRRGPASERLGP